MQLQICVLLLRRAYTWYMVWVDVCVWGGGGVPIESFPLLAQSGDPHDQLLEELKRFVWTRFSPGCFALYFFAVLSIVLYMHCNSSLKTWRR